jgi:ankyrin repeat protein
VRTYAIVEKAMDQPISKPTLAERMKSLHAKLQELEKTQSSLSDTSPLQEAIYNKDLEEIARLLDSGADINERNWYESTPLMCAVQFAGTADAPEGVRSLLAGKLSDLKQAGRENPPDLKTTLSKIQSIVPKVDDFRKMRNEALDRNRKEADAEGAERRKQVSPEDLAVIRFLIERCADIEARDKEGHTAIFSAASSGCDEVANLLLDSGADVETADKDGKTPLMAAVEECRPAMVRLLLERGANPHARSMRGGTVLMAAAAGGSLKIVRLILDRKVEINAEAEDGTTALITARGRGYTDVVELLMDAGAEPGVLDAIMAGDQTEAERMARRDSSRARTRHWGRSVMFWAAREARPDVIRVLHNYGVSANVEDSRGKTPIMHASIRGDQETMCALLECGAAPNPTVGEHGMSPMQWAASMGDIDKVRVLIASGANVNEEDRHGGTPLGVAVMRGHTEVASVLLEAGANPNAKGCHGWQYRNGATVDGARSGRQGWQF